MSETIQTRPVTPISPAAANAAAAIADAAGEKSTVTVVEEKTVGFFGRVARSLKRHPISTSVGISLGTASAVAGGINYRNTGRVLPSFFSPNDFNDVASALTSAFKA